MILKKLITLTLITLLSSAAAAETNEFICQTDGLSFGQPTDVTVTVTIEPTDFGPQPTTITAEGQSFMQFTGFSHLVRSNDESTQLLFVTQQENHESEMIINIQMQKMINGKGEHTVSHGAAQVIHRGFSRLQSSYSLRHCAGTLNL